jgi:Putative beta-barrel porin-2, OmpL-like. bbp2
MRKSLITTAVLVALAAPTLVFAEDAAPAAPAAPALMQGMNFPLSNNPNPLSFEAGPLGKVYVSGALSGIVLTQNHRAGTDLWGATKEQTSYGDLSNAQVILQKVDGLFQFYVQGGGYSAPTVGTTYTKSTKITSDSFGYIPVAFGKLALTENFSIQAGKLPTLIGTEYAFTFQNTNIERGLIWGQENVISRGVQANATFGPLAISGALTDGFYTQDYKYLTALATYTINDSNTVSIAAGGNPSGTKLRDIDNKLPIAQNSVALANSQQYNLYYKNVTGAWTFQPILQYTKVNSEASLDYAYNGSTKLTGGHTFGGSLIVNYDFNENYSLAARGEYIKETGHDNLLAYGANAPKAWTFTLTPTYKQKSFFARADLSYVKINGGDSVNGLMFGTTGKEDTQARAIGEVGFLF